MYKTDFVILYQKIFRKFFDVHVLLHLHETFFCSHLKHVHHYFFFVHFQKIIHVSIYDIHYDFDHTNPTIYKNYIPKFENNI